MGIGDAMLTKEQEAVIDAARDARGRCPQEPEACEGCHMLHVCAAVDALNAAPPSDVVDFQYMPPKAEGKNVMIPCVKIVRYYGGLGLKEAYELCKQVQARVPQQVYLIRGGAQSMIRELEEYGARGEVVKEKP